MNKESALSLTKNKGNNNIEPIQLAEQLGNIKDGPKIIVITCATEGVFVYGKNQRRHTKPDINISNVETTGAGDAVGSGFISALIRGKSLEKAALLGVLKCGICY